MRAFVEHFMGNTVVASVSPNGESFAGNRREKAAVGVLLARNPWRKKQQPRWRLNGALTTEVAWWWRARWLLVAASPEPWRKKKEQTREGERERERESSWEGER